jgi:hypothetical protein
MFPKKRNSISHNELISQNGWTEELVEQVLGMPDIVLQFPRDEDAAPARYYHRYRVAEAEEKQEVAAIVRPRAEEWEERQRYIRASKTDRRLIVLKAVSPGDIVVERIPLATLKTRALETFYARNGALGRSAPQRLDQPTLRKIYLNFAVGQLVDYDGINARLLDPLSKAELYKLIGAEIMARVVEAYPELGPEIETAAPESQGAAVGNSV